MFFFLNMCVKFDIIKFKVKIFTQVSFEVIYRYVSAVD